jgi:hypothetical protein
VHSLTYFSEIAVARVIILVTIFPSRQTGSLQCVEIFSRRSAEKTPRLRRNAGAILFHLFFDIQLLVFWDVEVNPWS